MPANLFSFPQKTQISCSINAAMCIYATNVMEKRSRVFIPAAYTDFLRRSTTIAVYMISIREARKNAASRSTISDEQENDLSTSAEKKI